MRSCSRRGKKREICGVLSEKLKEINHMEHISVDVRIVLREVGWRIWSECI
jgi:hypothetical protein